MKDKSGGCYVPVSTAVSVLGVLGLEPAFLSEEPCMAVTCANPLLLVLNSYEQDDPSVATHMTVADRRPDLPMSGCYIL